MEKQNCKICEKEFSINYNFCPYCGCAVTDIAKRLNKEKCDLIKLKVINELTQKVSDKKTLKILNDLADKISQ